MELYSEADEKKILHGDLMTVNEVGREKYIYIMYNRHYVLLMLMKKTCNDDHDY